MSKYEKLIEYIVNEQDEKARELFHQLVVERSRQIYESLIDEEDLAEIGGDEVEDLVDEITADEDGMLEAEDDDDSVGMDDDDMDMGDAEDEEDMDMDMDDDEEDSEDMEMGDEEDSEDMGDGDLENRIMDLEDSLDDLKREFEELMGQGDEMGGDMDAGMDTDMDMDADMDMEDDMAENLEVVPDYDQPDLKGSVAEARKMKKEEMLKDKAKAKSKKKMTEAEWIREYVEKIGDPYPGNNSETGEVGAGGSASLNTKSIVAGKNDMGGTTQNIARGGSESEPKGTPSNKPSGLLKKGGDLIGKVQNSPGANAGKTGYKTSAGKEYSKAHDKEGQTTAGSMSVDKKSLLGH
jgi:hypothetical protein